MLFFTQGGWYNNISDLLGSGSILGHNGKKYWGVYILAPTQNSVLSGRIQVNYWYQYYILNIEFKLLITFNPQLQGQFRAEKVYAAFKKLWCTLLAVNTSQRNLSMFWYLHVHRLIECNRHHFLHSSFISALLFTFSNRSWTLPFENHKNISRISLSGDGRILITVDEG